MDAPVLETDSASKMAWEVGSTPPIEMDGACEVAWVVMGSVDMRPCDNEPHAEDSPSQSGGGGRHWSEIIDSWPGVSQRALPCGPHTRGSAIATRFVCEALTACTRAATTSTDTICAAAVGTVVAATAAAVCFPAVCAAAVGTAVAAAAATVGFAAAEGGPVPGALTGVAAAVVAALAAVAAAVGAAAVAAAAAAFAGLAAVVAAAFPCGTAAAAVTSASRSCWQLSRKCHPATSSTCRRRLCHA